LPLFHMPARTPKQKKRQTKYSHKDKKCAQF
jgi:hypothetical protein